MINETIINRAEVSSPLTHKVYLLPLCSYLARSKSVSSAHPSVVRPSDLDTITNTALEAAALSSGKKLSKSTSAKGNEIKV